MSDYNSEEMNRQEESVLRAKCSTQRVSALAINSLAFVLFLLVAVAPSYSQTKAEKKELAALYQKASDGDVNSQLELGTRYLLGRGVAIEDAVQARDWFTKAADKGNATAQFWLGEMYSTGWGIPEDKARAAIWYRKAADQGLATAQYALGNMYETGGSSAKPRGSGDLDAKSGQSRFCSREVVDEDARHGLTRCRDEQCRARAASRSRCPSRRSCLS